MSSDDARDRPETALAVFASTVARDLETPLQVARGHLSLLEADGERVDAIDDALADAERVLSELQDLADGGRFESLTRVPLGVAAHSAWESLPTDAARLSMRSNRPIPVDPETLERLFTALFEQFLDSHDDSVGVDAGHSATDESQGRVRAFTVEQVTDRSHDGLTVTVGELADGFYVEADGDGIDGDLATVERLAATHGWTVERDTSPEGGARVAFRGVGRRT